MCYKSDAWPDWIGLKLMILKVTVWILLLAVVCWLYFLLELFFVFF